MLTEEQKKANKKALARKWYLANKKRLNTEWRERYDSDAEFRSKVIARSKQQKSEETHNYCVYYIAEEHYIGSTNNLKARCRNHRKNNKVVDAVDVIAYFDNKRDALLFERNMHKLGFYGCQWNIG